MKMKNKEKNTGVMRSFSGVYRFHGYGVIDEEWFFAFPFGSLYFVLFECVLP